MSDDVAELRAELEVLRRRVGELEEHRRPDVAPTTAAPDAGPDRSSDRRGFHALAAGTAVAGAAAAVGGATPAAATTGEPFLLGQTNSATAVGDITALESVSSTALEPTLFRVANWTSMYWGPNPDTRVASYAYASGPDDGGGLPIGMMGRTNQGLSEDPRGVGVYGVYGRDGSLPLPTDATGVYGYANGDQTVGVKGHAVGNATTGVHGVAEGSGFGFGVLGEGSGVNGTGVIGRVDDGGGVAVYAGAPAPSTALWVRGRLHHAVGDVLGPPPGPALVGDQSRDITGAMFLCTASGTPGTWRSVVAQHPDYANAGGSINLLARPIRVVDTRPTSTAPLKNGGNRLAPTTSTSFQITGTTVAGVSVPAGATGILANITATDTLGSGFFSVFASGLSPTGTSTVNYTDVSIANFFMSALSTSGALTVRCGSNAAHCIIDVMGFLY